MCGKPIFRPLVPSISSWLGAPVQVMDVSSVALLFSHSAVNCVLTKLFLCAQYVKARFPNDLTIQLQYHIRVRVLLATLVIHLQGGTLVDLITALVYKATTCR